jgi:uncharacterized integral membrane protein
MGAMARDEEGTSEDRPVSRRRDAQLILLGFATVALVWFALSNFRSVTIDFWLTHAHAPLILVILISGLLGAGIAALAMRRRSPR